MNNGLQVYEAKAITLSPEDIIAQVALIDKVKKEVMLPGVHYAPPFKGAKDALLKPGAEKLRLTFRIDAQVRVEDLSTDDEYRVRVYTTGVHIPTGQRLGDGLGECSSAEEKYAWRAAVSEAEFNATPANRKRIKYEKDGTTTNQIRREIADVRNTILKMAKKRSDVDMTISVTAASDMFDQDTEEMDEEDLKSSDGSGKPSAAAAQDSYQINDVKIKKQGEGKKGPWTIFSIIAQKIGTQDIKSYSTFDTKHADLAKKIMADKGKAYITSKEGEYGMELLTITEAEEKKSKLADKAKPGTEENRGHGDEGLEGASKQAAQTTAPVIHPRVQKVIDSFGSLGITREQLEAYVNLPVEKWTPETVETYGGIWIKLNDGQHDPKEAVKELFKDLSSGKLFPEEKEPETKGAFD